MEGRALVGEDEVARLQEALDGRPKVALCKPPSRVGPSVGLQASSRGRSRRAGGILGARRR